MPKHSIVISSYNRPIWIGQCIASVLAQTNPDWEAFIADDGSTPETLQAIRKACGEDPRIRLIECATPYLGDDRGSVLHRYGERINEALALCSGEIVHYLADDDWYDPGRLAVFDTFFKSPEAMVGYGRMTYVNRDGKPFGEERWPKGPTRNVQWRIDHNQVAHRKSVFEKVPRWPIQKNSFALDACFFVALAEHWDFVPVDGIVAFKRMHSFNLTNTRFFTSSKRE